MGGGGGGAPAVIRFWRYVTVCEATSLPIRPAPVGSGTVRSTPHAMLATSSRTSNTSSTGGPSCDLARLGSSNNVVSAAAPAGALRTLMVNMLHRLHSLSIPLPAASIQKRSPKTLLTASPCNFTNVPTGSVEGTTNQSLE